MSTVITFSLPNIEDVISVSFIIKLIRKTTLKRMSEHVISEREKEGKPTVHECVLGRVLQLLLLGSKHSSCFF